MNKTIKRLKNSIIALSVVLGTVIIVLSIMLAVFVTKSDNYKLQLQNTYKKNLYEFVSNINSLEVDLSKLVATNSVKSQRQLLSNIYDTCRTGAVNLSTLPISNNKTQNISNYLNTAGGYMYSLLQNNISANSTLNESEISNVEGLYNYCLKIVYDLNDYMSDIENMDIIKLVNYSNGELSSFDGGLTTVNDDNKEIPSLIYDGPFSDGVLNKEIKGLGSNVVGEEDARNYIKQNFSYYGDYNIEYMGETNGKFATYNYRVFNSTVDLYVQITKQGGFLLSINDTRKSGGDLNLTTNQCEIFAHNFASLLGMDNMYAVWTQDLEDICYINLAPIVDRVIYYPDIIKVKVDKHLGLVVGWEASNYAYNHTKRTVKSPTISFEEAQKLLSKALTVKERNLCVIPNEFSGESMAYEFVCTWKDYVYYIYLDVDTGEELKIMRIVDTSTGSLLL